MTIASAFNDITAAQGGTPNNSGTIAGAIDALNDTLAGSDQPTAQTIEGAIRLLGEHIGGGGGGGGTEYAVKCYTYLNDELAETTGKAYQVKIADRVEYGYTYHEYAADTASGTIDKAAAGSLIAVDYNDLVGESDELRLYGDANDIVDETETETWRALYQAPFVAAGESLGGYAVFVMPNHDAAIIETDLF